MADDAAILLVLILGVFLQEGLRAGEGHLVDVLLDFLLRHAHAVVDEAQRLRRLVDLDMDGAVLSQLVIDQAQLGDRVAGVGNDLADEDVLVGIEPLLDDGHDILRIDGYAAGYRIHKQTSLYQNNGIFL